MNSADNREGLRGAILASPSYRLAHEDADLLADADLRPLRLQLELVKPERALRQHAIRSTVVVFGSARMGPAGHEADPERAQRHARYLDEARRFAGMVSRRFQEEGRRDFVVVTGGGPGIMEAANRGAWEVGARSMGLNITLPHEQAPNPFITPDLAFRFRYFAIRKMHFALRARAMVAFPGGYGTLDEVFEMLALVQTGKMEAIPIVLFGSAFWSRAVDFGFLVAEGMIDPADVDLFTVVDTAEEAIAVLENFYGGKPPP
ncbi:TIGR00730 family Rossman fold protein [Thioclava sp. A2]|uniref:LOG family protein n=1 Tax=Thioclava sp. FCG-A2 TaxID=3080562 RepID=UPI002952EC5B|nr:TIGR00730 family Rossman fold protein [Thioclava sp. A2]MDV7271932.1 TIGR00730 family Rossman fold protein [Thioclava sp. A2]